jgi:uncharacterized membrane protein
MSRILPLNYLEAASRWFGRSPDRLANAERRALDLVVQGRTAIEDPNRKIDEGTTFGERVADRVASFGGSWVFIISFGLFLLAWATLNTELLGKTAFDPYPYVFLNLILSMLAALQAPVIMMSQNRQATKDRQMAAHDYEVNLKAEIEIMALHEKVDLLRTQQLAEIVRQQQQQIDVLTALVTRFESIDRGGDGGGAAGR